MALDNPKTDIIAFRFLYYALLWRGLNDAITGAAQPQITRASLSRVSIPIPPLAEQGRIVKLLDEADELRKLRAEANRRTATLIPALFHKKFGDPLSASCSWQTKELCRLGRVVTGSTPSSAKEKMFGGENSIYNPRRFGK